MKRTLLVTTIRVRIRCWVQPSAVLLEPGWELYLLRSPPVSESGGLHRGFRIRLRVRFRFILFGGQYLRSSRSFCR